MGDQLFPDIGLGPPDAVGEGDRLDVLLAVVPSRMTELALDREAVGRAFERDDEVVAAAGQEGLRGLEPRPEVHGVVVRDGHADNALLDRVLAEAGGELVDVAPVLASEHVVAAAAIDRVGAVRAFNRVVARRRLTLQKVRGRERRAVREPEELDRVLGRREVTPDGQRIGRPGDRDRQVVADPREGHLGGQHVRRERDGVGLILVDGREALLDRVLARALAEQVGVTAAEALEEVVAGPAVEDVAGEEAFDRVVAGRLGLA